MSAIKNENIIGAFAYVFGWLSGLVAYLIGRESPFVRFHALQSIMLSLLETVFAVVFMVAIWIAAIILAIATGGLGVLLIPAGLVALFAAIILLDVFLVYKAYKGLKYKLPFIGALTEKYA